MNETVIGSIPGVVEFTVTLAVELYAAAPTRRTPPRAPVRDLLPGADL